TAPLFIVENGAENARGVEEGKTQPIDRAVEPHQGRGPHIADEPVVLDWLVRHPFSCLKGRPGKRGCRALAAPKTRRLIRYERIDPDIDRRAREERSLGRSIEQAALASLVTEQIHFHHVDVVEP